MDSFKSKAAPTCITSECGPLHSHEGNKFLGQTQRAYLSFCEKPKTMLQVSIETGILRANICRYVRSLLRQNKIVLHHAGLCPISKHRAGFYVGLKDGKIAIGKEADNE